MEQRITIVLFYGALGLVALTCGAELLHLWKLSDAGWAGAYGSWFGGAGSFAAVVAALAIAGWQQRNQIRITAAADRKRSKIVLYQLRRQFMRLSLQLGPMVKDEYLLFFQIHAYRENKVFLNKALLLEAAMAPKLTLNELVYVDEISTLVLEMYDRMDIHVKITDLIFKTKDEDALANILDELKTNLNILRSGSVAIARASGKALALLGTTNRARS